MGSASSKFKKCLLQGDEVAALSMYEKHPELRKCVDVNAPLGDLHLHNTYLHLVCRHAMKHLLGIFLGDLGGNPNKKNSLNMTCLHQLCLIQSRSGVANDAKLRLECLVLLLAWQGSEQPSGEKERLNIDAIDTKGNTGLHYAACNNLKGCVELLVSNGANIFLENESHETACDCAQTEGFHDIAQFLETKMVFFNDDAESVTGDLSQSVATTEVYSGLREQDLREAKDQLLVETSDMLHVPLFTAEALLRNHEWSREALVESWMANPVTCCVKSGVHPPPFLSDLPSSSKNASLSSYSCAGEEQPRRSHVGAKQQHSSIASDLSETQQSEDCTPTFSETVFFEETFLKPLSSHSLNCDIECQICTNMFSSGICVSTVCDHTFCQDCWRCYLHIKIQEGDLSMITCPAFGCSKLVPVEIIERVLSPQTARKYLKFDIKAFVDSNPRIKWCPAPGCSAAVKALVDEPIPLAARIFPRMPPPPPTSHTVFCPAGHEFCWHCFGEGHEPTACEKWREWHEKIASIKPQEPPIQKNEGCNHMKCSKCKHDFCWVCLEKWAKHGTETGGFFRCNRYDESRKVEERNEQIIADAQESNKRHQELNKFVHYYTRYKNHLNSLELEKPLLEKIESKMERLAKLGPFENERSCVNFIKHAVEELLRSRKILSSSYAYGYFLRDHGYNKTIFEYLQNELEVSTESLSALVARPYLRSSRSRIIHTTYLVKQRRQSFLVCINRGLLPPETPPGLRKFRKNHLPTVLGIDAEEDDWLKALSTDVNSVVIDVDPARPWVKDNRGRHKNLYALLNWDEQSDDESYDTSGNAAGSSTSDLCTRPNCGRLRARNPLTGQAHTYCSLKCRYLHTADEDGQVSQKKTNREYNVDLMIALQMSRLQLLQDLKLIDGVENTTQNRNSRSASIGVPDLTSVLQAEQKDKSSPDQKFVFGEDVDPYLQLAIERSLLDCVSPVSDTDNGSMAAVDDIALDCVNTNDGSEGFNIPTPEVDNSKDSESLKLFVRRFTAKENFLANANLLSVVNEAESAFNAAGVDKKTEKALLQSNKETALHASSADSAPSTSNAGM